VSWPGVASPIAKKLGEWKFPLQYYAAQTETY